jgi:hypothetical protein
LYERDVELFHRAKSLQKWRVDSGINGSGVLKNPSTGLSAGPAGFAISAYFGARDGDLYPCVALDLPFKLLEEFAFHLAHFAAAQASHMDVIARTMALIEVPVPVNVQKIELVEQAMLLEHLERAVDGYAVNARIDLLRTFENRVGGKVLLGLIHHFEQDAALAREPYASPLERRTQPARFAVGVQSFTGGNPALMRMGRGAHFRKRLVAWEKPQDVIVHDHEKHQQQEDHADRHHPLLDLEADIVAQQALYAQHQDVAAVQNGDWQ